MPRDICYLYARQTTVMKNADIAAAFRELGNLMELHGENKFKVRSYQNAT
jgi:DNA polymerase/3'-5' exonuclease PolX